MCGRYASTQTDVDLLALFSVAEAVGDGPPASYNVAPTDPVRVVLERTPRGEPRAEQVRQLRTARWGLVPSWAKDVKIGARLINARSETITEKPAFTAAAGRRRCLVPADGYFEWEKREGAKVPYFLHGDAALAFAGLYELWRDPARAGDDPLRWVWSVTILTTTAADSLGHIHERTPLVLPAELHEEWLDPSITELTRVKELVAAVPEPRLHPRQVSSAVNSVRNNGPELLRAV